MIRKKESKMCPRIQNEEHFFFRSCDSNKSDNETRRSTDRTRTASVEKVFDLQNSNLLTHPNTETQQGRLAGVT